MSALPPQLQPNFMAPTTTLFSWDAAEKYLSLPDGRTLAYEDGGDLSSSTLVLRFHGAFSVGNLTSLPEGVVDWGKNYHIVNPSLPGWGRSSPRKKNIPYHISLANDITALLDYLHPGKEGLEIYIAGGAWGSIPAQMLYGASFDIFPLGRYVKGCMILHPFSPFREHKDYAKGLQTAPYFQMGPHTQFIPFNLFARISKLSIAGHLKTVDSTEAFLRPRFSGSGYGIPPEQKLRHAAEVMFRSVQESWDGFLEMADVAHGDWGFSPRTLDEKHNMRPIFIVVTETQTPNTMATWLAASYSNSRYRLIVGANDPEIANSVWKEFVEMC